jgi:dynein assembly factor 3
MAASYGDAGEDADEDFFRSLMISETCAETKSESASRGSTEAESSDDIKILLIGASDIRHIFKTLAAMRVLSERSASDLNLSGERMKIHFYIYEPNLRVHARHLFFLQWLCDSLFSLNELEDRVSMFLETYGNILLREPTNALVKAVSARALRTLGYNEGALSAMVDVTELKSKERDFIEEQLKCWTKDSATANIAAQWDKRLKIEMAERFDNKDNIIDWDYNFHLREYTNAIKFQEYRKWRTTGVAFDYCHINPRRGFQYDYVLPNKTLCQFARGGGIFLGDVKNGPFFSFGIESANPYLKARAADGTLKFGNGVIAMQNVRAWLYELMTGQEWPWSDHTFAWDDIKNYNILPPGTPNDVEYRSTLPNAAFHFIGLDLERFLLHWRTGHHKKFDAAFIGANSTQFMSKRFFECMYDDGTVFCETIKFVIDAKDEAKQAFIDKISEFGKPHGWMADPVRTEQLQSEVPPPKSFETAPSEAMKRSASRYKSPAIVALTKQPVAN